MYQACKIDTRHHWEVANDFPRAGDRQGIFIVETGPIDVDRHIPFWQLLTINILDLCQGFFAILFQ
ncbi:hypothetical protein D3C77_736660 [compost metagenome]